MNAGINIFLKALIYTLIIIIPIILVFVCIRMKQVNFIEKFRIFKLKVLLIFNRQNEARKYALKIVEKYPKSYITHKMLGELYEKEGKINLALDEYIRAVDLDDKDFEAQYKVAFLLNKTEKNDEAIIMLQDLLKVKPDYLDATLLLGNIYYDEDRFKEAVSLYVEALKYFPTKYELYYNLGMTYTRLNDFQKAKEFYDKAARLNSYLYNGQYNLALIAMIQGELIDAQAYFLRCLQCEEIEPIAYYYLAQIAMLKQETSKAVSYINIALELDKNIEERIQKQPLFLPIKDDIRIPNETRKIEIKLTKKEIETNIYLEKMYNVVASLNGSSSKINMEQEEKEEYKENFQINRER